MNPSTFAVYCYLFVNCLLLSGQLAPTVYLTSAPAVALTVSLLRLKIVQLLALPQPSSQGHNTYQVTGPSFGGASGTDTMRKSISTTRWDLGASRRVPHPTILGPVPAALGLRLHRDRANNYPNYPVERLAHTSSLVVESGCSFGVIIQCGLCRLSRCVDRDPVLGHSATNSW